MPKRTGELLAGKTILITGAAKRLGRAIALAAARNGADVAITYRTSSREARRTLSDLTTFGVRAFSYECDITDENSIRSMMKQAVRDLGRLDVLVNNAANYETVRFDRLTAKKWDAIFASNARGPFLVSQAAAKHLDSHADESSTWARLRRPHPGPPTRTTAHQRRRCTCSLK